MSWSTRLKPQCNVFVFLGSVKMAVRYILTSRPRMLIGVVVMLASPNASQLASHHSCNPSLCYFIRTAEPVACPTSTNFGHALF